MTWRRKVYVHECQASTAKYFEYFEVCGLYKGCSHSGDERETWRIMPFTSMKIPNTSNVQLLKLLNDFRRHVLALKVVKFKEVIMFVVNRNELYVCSLTICNNTIVGHGISIDNATFNSVIHAYRKP